MKFGEKILDAKMHDEVVPLKGHTKIILADALTGKVTDVVESDNMVTNAVQDVLNHNFGGFSNFSNSILMPYKNLFNGVMLFQEQITESASNYLIPSDLDNPMIANAGPTPHATASVYRGNPNGGESQETSNSVKFVWDWSTNQGNGRINCVCLCPGIMGNIGLKPIDDTQTPYYQIARYYQTGGNITEEWAIKAPFNTVYDQYHYSIWLDGATFKLKKVKHDYSKFGILRNNDSFAVVNERTATIRTGNNRFVAEGMKNGIHYYYVIHATSATTLMVDRIKANLDDTSEALVVDTLDVTCSDTSFYTNAVESRNGSLPIFAVDGDYLYYMHSGRTKLYKINLYNNADVTLLDGETTIEWGSGATTYNNREEFSNPIVISNGLVFGSTYIINGGKIYPLKRTNNIGLPTSISYFGYRSCAYFARKNDAPSAAYAISRQNYDDTQGNGQSNILVPTFLSTINNLEDEITKSPSKTMKVEYTLTEA